MSKTKGTSIFMTGANGGLGKETCKLLIEDGFTRVVMAGRSETKIKAARDEVIAATGPGDGTTITAVSGFDMNDPAKIIAAVDALPAGEPFDVVFLQAGGVVFSKDYSTVEWNGRRVEKTIFQNVIGGHVTLSRLLERGLLAPGARVVVAGGEGARGIPGLIEKPSFDSPAELRRYVRAEPGEGAKYDPMKAIGVSKLLSALWCLTLAEQPALDMSVVWFSPGLTYGTDGLAEKPPVQRWFLETVMFGLMRLLGKAQSPRDGARKYADCLERTIGDSGDIIGAPEGKALGELVDQTPMNAAFSDRSLREEFWRLVEEVCGPFGGTGVHGSERAAQ